MLRTTKGLLLSACLAIALSPGILTAQTPDTFDDPTPLTESGLTRSEVLQAFARLAYGTNPDKDAPGRLTRWEQGEVAVHWKGTLGSNGIRAERPWYAEVHAVIDELDNVEGVPPLLSLFDTDSADIEVYLLASGEIDARLANAPEEQRAWLMQDCGIDAAADTPLIFIKYDLSINEVRACIVSMMTKSLGFTDTEDVAELPGSNLDMTPSYPYLTNLDKVLVQVLYDSRYAPTMSRQEGMATAARIVADLVP